MKNLTTPQAILGGFVLVALAIASIPYSSNIVTPAQANSVITKVTLCDYNGTFCGQLFQQPTLSEASNKSVRKVTICDAAAINCNIGIQRIRPLWTSEK